MTLEKFENLAIQLEQSEDYRVTRRLTPKSRYRADDDLEKKTAIFLDVETTGLESQTDHVIELALVAFEFNSAGGIYRILDTFDGLEDPGVTIPEKITQITGITQEMVTNQKIEDKIVTQMVEQAAVIIAHNARFDRPFVEQRWPVFEKKAWACSLSQIPWSELGFESAKLEYLAYRMGFFFDGHRADSDCKAGIEILSRDVGEQSLLKCLLDNARAKDYRVWAVGAPFEVKDELKNRGYRWNNGDNGKPKSWYREIPADDLAQEKDFLYSKILPPDQELIMDTITPFNRFSQRC